HSGAAVAVGLGGTRGTGFQVHREQREQKRQEVGKIVSRLGEQSQRMRTNAGDDQQDDVSEGDDERDAKNLRGSLVGGMSVDMHCLKFSHGRERVQGKAGGRRKNSEFKSQNSLVNLCVLCGFSNPRPQRTRGFTKVKTSRTPVAGFTILRSSREPALPMQTTEVVIIGGGIVGSSIAYHLVAGGCKDVLVIERETALGKGSTGKSMGGVRAQFSTPVNIQMSLYSIPFYASFEVRLGHPCDYRPQ